MLIARQQRALEYFTTGDNCSQAVFKAYCDLAGLTPEQAALVAVGFGGGIGRLRQNCGAFSGAVMICGALQGADGADESARAEVYRRVQLAHMKFIEKNGTINCAELLNRPAQPEEPTPDERTAEYYASRPCARIVVSACQVIEELMEEAGIKA